MNNKPRQTALSIQALTLGLALSLFSSSNWAENAPLQLAHTTPYENQLIQSFKEVQQQQLDGALETIETLVQDNPTFKLAQLVHGDLLLAKAGPISDIGSHPHATNDQLQGLRLEAQARWQHHMSHPGDKIPANLLQIDSNIEHIVVVDLNKSRLYLYQHIDGKPTLVTDYYVSIGKNGTIKQVEGDKRTPIGVYFITGFKPPETLPDMYGAGAFPIDYPNVLDKRLGKTGYGIWLHGTPSDTFSRQPRASDGCVTLSNSDLKKIKSFLKPGLTPVIIAEDIAWASPSEIANEQSDFQRVLSQWQRDWQSLNTDAYLNNYSHEFNAKGMDLQHWRSHKQKVNKSKSFIEVALSNINVFHYPGTDNLRLVTFEQDYKSNNYSSSSKKQQYWKLENDGAWRIIYEGPA